MTDIHQVVQAFNQMIPDTNEQNKAEKWNLKKKNIVHLIQKLE